MRFRIEIELGFLEYLDFLPGMEGREGVEGVPIDLKFEFLLLVGSVAVVVVLVESVRLAILIADSKRR